MPLRSRMELPLMSETQKPLRDIGDAADAACEEEMDRETEGD